MRPAESSVVRLASSPSEGAGCRCGWRDFACCVPRIHPTDGLGGGRGRDATSVGGEEGGGGMERAAIDGEVAGIRVAGAQANGWLLLPSSLCARLFI